MLWKSLGLMLTGAACAVGGAVASGSLSAASAANPSARAAVSDRAVRDAIYDTSINTGLANGYLKDIRDTVRSIKCDVKMAGTTCINRNVGSDLASTLEEIERALKGQ